MTGAAAATSSTRADLTAGLTVALVGLPQCLAYAMMSGLPPAYGLATAAVPGVVAALLGRSVQVVTGPTNTTGLLVLGALSPFLATTGVLPHHALSVLATLTLLAGLLRLAVALSGGAGLLRFLPESVLVGFTAGAAVLIGAMQLDEALGLPPVLGVGLREEVVSVVTMMGDGHLPSPAALAITLSTIFLLVLGKRRKTRWPVALVAVAGATVLAAVLGASRETGLPIVGDRASVPFGWPPGALPSLSPDLVRSLFVPAAAIVLLGTLELTVTVRAGGERPDLRHEILTQGWANVVGAFASAFPASASLTRSALLRSSGARTRLAAGAAALFGVPVLFVGRDAVTRIPQSALAAVLLVTAWGMVDRKAVKRLLRAAPETRLLLGVTFFGTLILPLEWAILFGAGLGLVIHLARTSAPRLTLLVPEGDRLRPPLPGETPGTVVVEVSGDLHYAAVPPFQDELEVLLPQTVTHVVLDLSHAHQIRFTALLAFERLASELAHDGATLHLAGVDEDVVELLARAESGLPATPAEAEPGLSLRRCLEGID